MDALTPDVLSHLMLAASSSADPYSKIVVTMIALFIFNSILLLFSFSQTYLLIKLLKCSDMMMLQTILFTNMVSVLKEI